MTIKLLCFDTFMMQNLPRRHDNQQYPPMSSRCLFWPRINSEDFLTKIWHVDFVSTRGTVKYFESKFFCQLQ